MCLGSRQRNDQHNSFLESCKICCYQSIQFFSNREERIFQPRKPHARILKVLVLDATFFPNVIQFRDVHSVSQSQNCTSNMLRIQPSLFVLFILRSSFKVSIRDNHRPEFKVSIVHEAIQAQEVEHMVTETADTAFLDGNEYGMIIGQLPYKVHIQWFHEARISYCNSQSWILVFNFLSGNKRFM